MVVSIVNSQNDESVVDGEPRHKSAKTQTVDIFPYQASDKPEVLQLLQLGLGGEGGIWDDERVWNWKHEASPFGQSKVMLARSPGGELMGLRAFMRWEFRLGNNLLKGYRPVDTVTHPDHRRKGVFSALTEYAVNEAVDEGTDLLFNSPNSQSLPGYRKLGWSRVDEVALLMKIARPVRLARKVLQTSAKKMFGQRTAFEVNFGVTDAGTENISARQKELTELLKNVDEWQSSVIVPVRSVEYLVWRYEQHPVHTYAAISLEDDEGFEALCFVRPVARWGGRGGLITDIFLRRPESSLMKRLIDKTVDVLNLDVALMSRPGGAFFDVSLRKCGFRLQSRNTLNFVVKALSDDGRIPSDVRDRWHITMGDLEFF